MVKIEKRPCCSTPYLDADTISGSCKMLSFLKHLHECTSKWNIEILIDAQKKWNVSNQSMQFIMKQVDQWKVECIEPCGCSKNQHVQPLSPKTCQEELEKNQESSFEREDLAHTRHYLEELSAFESKVQAIGTKAIKDWIALNHSKLCCPHRHKNSLLMLEY